MIYALIIAGWFVSGAAGLLFFRAGWFSTFEDHEDIGLPIQVFTVLSGPVAVGGGVIFYLAHRS